MHKDQFADGASVNSNDTSTSTSPILIALAVIGGLLFVGLLNRIVLFYAISITPFYV